MTSSETQHLVGIDLGTTMSVIAHLDHTGVLRTLSNSDGEPKTPSAVYIKGSDVLVGRRPKKRAATHSANVATLVKRDIGKSRYSRKIDGRWFRPETLSAMILKKLKQDAERHIGPITRAVITVPAFFDDARRKATEDAGRIAGLDEVHMINEPTAAALAYCLEGQLDKQRRARVPDFPDGKMTAVVYDLGGGTFDVTCVRLESKRIDTLATDGAVKLGGKDWDDRIIKHVEKEHGLTFPPEMRHLAAYLAEITKEDLSEFPDATFEFSFNDLKLKSEITYEQFEEMTRDLLVRTEFYINNVVNHQAMLPDPTPDDPDHKRSLTWDDIDRVLLVGGSTRMPMVRKMVERLTNQKPDTTLDPDQVVAQGAAVYAAIQAARGDDGDLVLDGDLQDELNDVGVVDVNAHGLGIVVRSKKRNKKLNAILIPKNQQLPCAHSKVFPLLQDNVRTVRVKVLEGEAPDPEANIQLGECVITDLQRNLPRGSPVQVRLSYDADGRVSVMALDMTGGRFAHAEIERNSGLSENDIQREREFVSRLNIK